MSWTVHLGDSLAVLKTLADGSVDAVVTDPPYGLAFMGKKWDYDVPGEELWRECLRVLKPGGHLLAFAGTRTQHRMAVRIEDAGFEIRDMVAWVYGSGFPKSLDVSKALDRMAGAEREVVGMHRRGTGNHGTGEGTYNFRGRDVRNGSAHMEQIVPLTAPATPAAKEWQGWGTALKPSFEPITMARKPLGEGTVAANVLAWGVGGINVDGCRVACNDKAKFPAGVVSNTESVFGGGAGRYADRPRREDANASGRWPANLVHDGSEEVVGLFPVTTTGDTKPIPYTNTSGKNVFGKQTGIKRAMKGDTGSAARFFYCSKASRREREAGCEGLERRKCGMMEDDNYPIKTGGGNLRDTQGRNHHPTVKPIALMRWLCRLITPPGGLVLDPFMGSGTTGCAAILEGFNFVGIEREPEYIEIARRRITYWAEQAEAEREADEEDRQLRLLG